MNRIYYLIVLVFALGIAACDTQSDPDFDDPKPVALHDSLFVDASGIRIADIKLGLADGPVQAGNIIFGTYWLWMADSTFVDEVEFLYDVGVEGAPTEGWVISLLGMHEGGTRQAIIPPELAYGSEGDDEYNIPPNTTLIYETFIRQRDP